MKPYMFLCLLLTGCADVSQNDPYVKGMVDKFKSRMAAIDSTTNARLASIRSGHVESRQDQIDDLISQSQLLQMDINAAQIDQAHWESLHPWY
jgi:hypothetical protein